MEIAINNSISGFIGFVLLILSYLFAHYLTLKMKIKQREREEKQKYYTQFMECLEIIGKGSDKLSMEEKDRFQKNFAVIKLIGSKKTIEECFEYIEFFNKDKQCSIEQYLEKQDIVYTKLVNQLRVDYFEVENRKILKDRIVRNIVLEKVYKINLE